MMNKLKVLYVDTCHDVAGGQRSLIALLFHIKSINEFKILIDKRNFKYKKEILSNGIDESKIIYFNSTPLGSRLFGGLLLFTRLLLISKNFDLVHCNTFYDGLFAMPAFWLRGKKRIFRARCGIDLSNHGLIDSCIYKLSSIILANSEYVKDTFSRISKNLSKIQVIYNPLDMKFLDKQSQNYTLNREFFTIAVIGAITEVKNQMEVLIAFSYIPDQSLKLRFIGEPRSTVKDNEYYKKLKDFVTEHNLSNRVEFTGFVADVRSKLYDVSLVCVPSDREPLGRVIFETQLYEIPVLASDSGGNSELIEDGKTGYLYALGNIKELAEKLFFAKIDNSVITKNAKKFILKRFSPEETYLAEVNLYSSLVEKIKN